MKHIHLSFLLCLASLLASAQEPLNGDSLASDFRYLVKELTATHPDPLQRLRRKSILLRTSFPSGERVTPDSQYETDLF